MKESVRKVNLDLYQRHNRVYSTRVLDTGLCNRPELDPPEIRRKEIAAESARELRKGAERGMYPMTEALQKRIDRFTAIAEGRENVIVFKKKKRESQSDAKAA